MRFTYGHKKVIHGARVPGDGLARACRILGCIVSSLLPRPFFGLGVSPEVRPIVVTSDCDDMLVDELPTKANHVLCKFSVHHRFPRKPKKECRIHLNQNVLMLDHNPGITIQYHNLSCKYMLHNTDIRGGPLSEPNRGVAAQLLSPPTHLVHVLATFGLDISLDKYNKVL